MSGAWVAVGVAAATIGSQVYASNRQDRAQRASAKRQEEASANALKEQQMQFNKENQNEVDISGILNANKGGDTSSTMLTGPGGVGLGKHPLGGGSSLLGG